MFGNRKRATVNVEFNDENGEICYRGKIRFGMNEVCTLEDMYDQKLSEILSEKEMKREAKVIRDFMFVGLQRFDDKIKTPEQVGDLIENTDGLELVAMIKTALGFQPGETTPHQKKKVVKRTKKKK